MLPPWELGASESGVRHQGHQVGLDGVWEQSIGAKGLQAITGHFTCGYEQEVSNDPGDLPDGQINCNLYL